MTRRGPTPSPLEITVPFASRNATSSANRIPKVWMLRHEGIKSPAPAASREINASPTSLAAGVVARGTRSPSTRTLSSRARRRGRRRSTLSSVSALLSPTPPTTPTPGSAPPGGCKPAFSQPSTLAPWPSIGKDGLALSKPRHQTPGRGSEISGEGNSQRQLRVGLRLRSGVRRAALRLQRERLRAAGRAGGGQARLRRPGPRLRRGPRPSRARRERRDHRAQLGARRAHQRPLDGARGPGEPQPCPLDPPPRLSRRLARPASQGGRARRLVRPRVEHLRVHPARPRGGADRALARAVLVAPGLPAVALSDCAIW